MPPVIRLARGGDAEAVLGIYAPVIRDTAISFEYEVPAESEMRRRILTTLEKFPWLVCEYDGVVLGYSYAGEHRDRAGYQWSVDVSVYVSASARRKGVGQAMYRSLVNLLVLQGFRKAYAGITLPNQGSVGLHESIGFQQVGVYREVGYKFGAWHDVGWWHMTLKESAAIPSPPTWVPSAEGSLEWDAAMCSGLSLLRL